MQVGNRFRYHPTPAQAQTLLGWIGCQRFIYNAKVGEDRYFRSFARQSLAHASQFAPIDQQYNHFKTDLTPWLSEVPSQILRNGAVLWKQAYGRHFQKLGGRPAIHRKTGEQSVWLTSELFEFKPVMDKATGEIISHTLHAGTQKFPLGQIKFTAHKAFKPAASIHISINAGRWHVSFHYDDGVPEPSAQETTDYLMQFNERDLAAVTRRSGTKSDGRSVRRAEPRARRTGSRPSTRWPATSVMVLTCAAMWRTRPASAWPAIRATSYSCSRH